MDADTRHRVRFYIASLLSIIAIIIAYQALKVAGYQSFQQQEALAITADPVVNIDSGLEGTILTINIKNHSISVVKDIVISVDYLTYSDRYSKNFSICNPIWGETRNISTLNPGEATSTTIDIATDINKLNKIGNEAYGGHMYSSIRISTQFKRDIDNKNYSQINDYSMISPGEIIEFDKIVSTLFDSSASQVLDDLNKFDLQLTNSGLCPAYKEENDSYVLTNL